MSTLQKQQNKDGGLPSKLREALAVMVNRLGASGALSLLDKVATIQGINAIDDPNVMGFLVQEIGYGIESIPHWSGHKIVVVAHGIRPEDGVPFITAACGENRQITWYARPIDVNGSEVTEHSHNWYQDGRDRA
ncbi:hypothetical protein [Paenibacillus sp. NRS-1780]|uniref:hypothetical protein n=1 Tax=Paenibacillus sp. NRS-1780 TaxID=3233904 RepID=UPI003D2D81BF